MTGRDLLIALSVKYNGDFKKVIDAIHKKEEISDAECVRLKQTVKSKVVTVLDNDYPEELRHVYMPPLVLYYKGDISLLKSVAPRIGVIGSRECTQYGKQMTEKLVAGVMKGKASDPIIVNGGARGIDTAALTTSLNKKGKAIAVLGSGLEKLYPSQNKDLFEKISKTGLLLTEYPDQVDPAPDNFPNRNRIVASISDKILVTEAYVNSGTNLTVLYALRQGKDVMAVPHEAGKKSSCNKLIQDGAFAIDEVEDFAYLLHDVRRKECKELDESKALPNAPEVEEENEMEVE